jgi:hypothetical protein
MKGEKRKVRGRSNVPHDDVISEDVEKREERRYADDEEEGFRVLPPEEQRCVNAKLFLLKEERENGRNL